MAIGQSQRLDGIIVVEHHLHPANLELYLVFAQPLPPNWPPHMFSLLCEDPAEMAVTMQLK